MTSRTLLPSAFCWLLRVGSVARRALRFKVVEWVVQQWDSNPDIAHMLGPARRVVQPSILLQEEMCRSYGDCAVRSKEDYSALMQRDGVYGDQAEAAVAAYLSGVSLDIYVRLPHFFPANRLCRCACWNARLSVACQADAPVASVPRLCRRRQPRAGSSTARSLPSRCSWRRAGLGWRAARRRGWCC